MEARLYEAEGVIGALRNQEVDAIIGDKRVAMVRLKEVEEAVQQARAQLEQRVVERTADLAEANRQLQAIVEEQRQTQRELEETQRRLLKAQQIARLGNCQLREQAELLDLAHDMIFVHDMEGRIIFWNRGAERCYGWKKEEALGQLSYRLLQTEYCEPLIRITARIIRDGWWEGELTHTTRDGGKVTVATRWALRRGPDARPTAILEIDNDITQRKCAEREMAEARRFAESIVDTIRESLVVLDSQLRVISANRSFHEMFGTTHEQVEGRFFLALHDGAWDIPDLRDRFREVLSRGAGFEDLEVDCELASGSRTLVLGARPVREQVAEAGLILLVIQDITVCRRQEREIRTDKQQLASLTEELMLIEERQRRQIAQTLHDSVGESLTQVEQELTALHQESPAAMQDSLRQVCERVSRAVEWTRNLAIELSPSTLYAQGLVAAIQELAEQFGDCEGFVCRVHAPEEPIPVLSQVRTMLYRAVRELLVNVAKHAKARNVDIILDRDERSIRVSVEDDGNGFDPSALEAGRMSGNFGIHSVRERLTKVGGEFTMDSVEGRGTRVTLIAPLDLDYESDQGA
jgi:PAS domain S-box-containing protein